MAAVWMGVGIPFHVITPLHRSIGLEAFHSRKNKSQFTQGFVKQIRTTTTTRTIVTRRRPYG